MRARQLARRHAAWLARQAWDRHIAANRWMALRRLAAMDRLAWADQIARNRHATMSAPTLPVPAPAPPVGPAPVAVQSGNLISVRGIVVDGSIATSLQALLTAADAAGLTLGGAGYRDPAAQRRLRELHCPDPVNSPPSACSPSTARPGESMHEQGVAIDFTDGGSVIASRASAAYRWLEANAAHFGLINLPSEPWHWSVNGR